jgi:hypothetical protein
MTPKHSNQTLVTLCLLSLITLTLASSSSFPRASHFRQLLKSNNHGHNRSLGHTRSLSNAAPWRPIRIKFDLSAVTNKTSEMSIFILNIILVEVQNRLTQMLQVNGNTKIPMFTLLNCLQQNEIPDEYKNNETDADVVLFVKLQEFQESFLAYATNCLLSGDDFRPLVGMIMINTKFIPMTYSAIEPLKKALMHEILHVLAFDRFLYTKYPAYQKSGMGVMDTTQNSYTEPGAAPISEPAKTSVTVTSSAIIDFGKKFFGCNDFYGLFMENEGGNAAEQSHLDQRYFGNELMTAELTGNGVLSGFSLSLLSSINWYKVDFGFEEVLEWGKGAGCDFLFNPGNKFMEFCSGEVKGCSRLRLRRTKCQGSKFSNSYRIATSSDFDTCNNNFSFQYLHPFESNGGNSRCLDIEVAGAKAGGCYKTDCSTPSKLKIIIDGKEFVCNSDGDRITYQSLVVICPPRSEVCAFSCPNDCSGNGICMANNTCQCYHFFSGADCSTRRPCNSQESAICSKIQPPQVKSKFTDYSSVLKNVGQILDPNGTQTSFDKILKGANLDFKPMNATQQVSIIASTGSPVAKVNTNSNTVVSVNSSADNQLGSNAKASQQINVIGLFAMALFTNFIGII